MKKITLLKRLLVLAVATVMVLGAASCGGGSNNEATTEGDGAEAEVVTSPPEGPSDGGVLRVSVTAEGAAPMGVPWENTTNDTLFIVPMVESLVKERSDGTIEPYLAKSWNIDIEGGEILFELNEGIRFTDGTDFTSDDVVFSLTECINAGQLAGATGVEARGDYTVAVLFDAYQNNIINRLAAKTCGIISKDAFEANGIEWARENPVTTGPFKLESYTMGEELVLVKNDDYWGEGEPHLDGIHYLFIRDVMTQQAAMQSSGEQSLDALLTTSGEQAKTLQDVGFDVSRLSIGPLALIPSSKNADSPLANADVRKAIAWAIDRDAIAAARGFGILTPAYQMISEDWSAHLPDSENIGYDPEKAKQYLADAGYPDGFKTKIIAMPGFADRDAVVIMQSQLDEIGIEAELEFPDSGGYNNYRSTGWDGLLAQHFRVQANVNNMWNVYLTPEEVSLVSLLRDPAVMEALLVSSQTEIVEAGAAQAVVKAMHDSMMMIPVYNIYDIWVTKPAVNGAEWCEWGGSTVFLPEKTWLEQ
jgi:peptide/nickel transport system substrate-binding protein